MRHVLPFALFVALPACGGGGSPDADTPAALAAATPAEKGDPCRFLTAAEMTAITTDPVSQLIREENSCVYRSNPDDGVRLKVVVGDAETEMGHARRALGLLSGMGTAVADQGGAGADVAAMLKEKKEKPAIGDDALWGPATILYARKGATYVEIYPPTIHDPQTHSGYPLVSADEKRKIATAVANTVFAKAGG